MQKFPSQLILPSGLLLMIGFRVLALPVLSMVEIFHMTRPHASVESTSTNHMTRLVYLLSVRSMDACILHQFK